MPSSAISPFSDFLWEEYARFRVDAFPTRHFQPDLFHDVVHRIAKTPGNPLQVKEVGRSFEQRPIRLVTAGTGSTNVLLWSQMHGDESTATMAIADILNFLTITGQEETTKRLLASLTLHFLPVLNPDGALRCMRRTTQGIDMNRDALALVTPEARLLKQLQADLRPRFGYNLHDQELSTIGSSKSLTAIGLLAPAFDDEKSDNDVRRRAKLLASIFAGAVHEHAAGSVARYDDTFEPRAFGDNMQKWGTSTLLVESGHAINDPEKNLIRKLNFMGILTTFNSISTGEYERSDLSQYESLPFNGKKAYDVIVRNCSIDHGSGMITRADLGISYQVDTHSESPPKLVDVGDLSTYTALKEIDGSKKIVPASSISIGAAIESDQLLQK